MVLHYLKGRSTKVRNGKSTLFWEEPWLKSKPFCVLYPVLYDLCTDKGISVHQFILKHAQLYFSRWLPVTLFGPWVSLIDEVYSYPFENEEDKI